MGWIYSIRHDRGGKRFQKKAKFERGSGVRFAALLLCPPMRRAFFPRRHSSSATSFVMVQGIVGAFLVRIPVSLFMSRLEPVSLFRVGPAAPCSTLVQIVLFLGCCAFAAARDRQMETVERKL